MEKHKGMITFGGNPLTLSGPLSKVGNLAPDFTAINKDLSPFKFSDTKENLELFRWFPPSIQEFVMLKHADLTRKPQSLMMLKL